ncbi:hypothetical protein C5748_07775 [Phyllobacterium phragmitis]|uniref:Phage tail protein n=1 Tax=Phyllobacterium phragmitis TaxID=2670329 RepID=A0A2S9IVF1_9HYPH|nr:mitofilin family membrane protein [Phyllobacterium phragmitis]PRD44460.1 hypothetical protein C5748_07775 [Phyllobacterium phragmitis]
MAKSGTPRHSKSARKPVTIDLDPSQVKRVSEPAEANPKSAPGARTPPAEPVGDFSKKPKAAPVKPDGAKPDGAKPGHAQMKTEELFAGKSKPRPSATASAASAAGRGPAAAQPAKPASNSGGGFSALAAGLAGGVIALAGAAALQWGNVLPSPGGDGSADRLARIEQEIAQLRAAPPPAAGLDEESRAQLAEAHDTARQALQHAQGAASDIAALKQAVEAQPAGDNTAPAQELTGRIAALEEKLASAQAQAAQAANAASDDSSSIAEVQSKLAALENRVAESSRQPAIAAAIAATALKSAIDRGGSFAAELDAYASVAPQSADIEALRKFAGTGVPTVADLNSRFGQVADRIVATESDVDPNAGFVDQLMASARSLVKVRPVGEVSGEGVGAITARIETALAAGDLDRAITEWETLPDDAKAVSADFADEMKARRDTDALVARTLAAALKPATPASPATPSAN